MAALNQKEAEIHFQAAQRFDVSGDYVSAREHYWKALVNARASNAPPATMSMLAYNFGRTTGYTCHPDEAEKYLLEALQLEAGVTGPESNSSTMRLLELARLYFDRGDHYKASVFYGRGIPILENLDVSKSDPIALAEALDEYAVSLAKVGRTADSAAIQQRASDLRRSNPGSKARFVHTRYKC